MTQLPLRDIDLQNNLVTPATKQICVCGAILGAGAFGDLTRNHLSGFPHLRWFCACCGASVYRPLDLFDLRGVPLVVQASYDEMVSYNGWRVVEVSQVTRQRAGAGDPYFEVMIRLAPPTGQEPGDVTLRCNLRDLALADQPASVPA